MATYQQVHSIPSLHSSSPAGITALTLSKVNPSHFVTGGNDKVVQMYDRDGGKVVATLKGHTKRVNTVVLREKEGESTLVVSGAADKTVRIWTSDASAPGQWTSTVLEFDSVLWRVSWSLSGNILAVSGGDNKVTLWKENLKGQWEKVKDIDE